MEQMYCGNCKEQLPPNAHLCPGCGIMLAGIKKLTLAEKQALEPKEGSSSIKDKNESNIEIIPGNEIDAIFQAEINKLDKAFQKCLQAISKGQSSNINKAFRKIEDKFDEENTTLLSHIENQSTDTAYFAKTEMKVFKIFNYVNFLHTQISKTTKEFAVQHENDLQTYLNFYVNNKEKSDVIIKTIQLAY